MMKAENHGKGQIHVNNYDIGSSSFGKEAQVNKVAFNIPVDPVAVASAIAGGYTANHVYNNKQGELQQQSRMQQPNFFKQPQGKIENDEYAQIESILRDLRITFTPINVVYAVNQQPFEMINVDEMTPQMKKSFLMRDVNFFRSFLVNKMTMEMQLAQQMFATRLLQSQEKLASFVVMAKVESDGFDKVAFEKEWGDRDLKIPVSFDNIRPFEDNPSFMTEKIAGFFSKERNDVLSIGDLEQKTDVGFLPDRVLFMVNGQMIEQLPLRGMNEEGYTAFRSRDKDFFLDWFNDQAKKVHQSTVEEVTQPDLFKEAASLKEVLDEKAAMIQGDFKRDSYDWFNDHDVHPIIYLHYLEKKIGQDWYLNDLEAIISTIEDDMATKVEDIPFNKIGMMQTLYQSEHTMFLSSFTYEKFARTMAGRDIDFEQQEPGLTMGEMLFANEIAQFIEGDDVYAQFIDQIAQYFSYEVTDENVRVVNGSLYESDSRFTDEFYEKVNGYLNRQWSDKDVADAEDVMEYSRLYKQTEIVATASKAILDKFAEFIDFENVEESVLGIISANELFLGIDFEKESAYLETLIKNIEATIDAAVYLETQRDLLEHQLELWKG